MDHHVRSAVTKGLRRRGIDVLIAFEDGWAEAPDAEVLGRASLLGRVLFTQDDDFLAIADAMQRNGPGHGGLVYAHQLQVTVGQIVTDLQLILEVATRGEMFDTVLFLPL